MARPCALWAILGALAVGCGDERESDPVAGADDPCGEDTPLVTWDTYAQGFLTTYCQGCHASTALDRKGAPEDVVFDTEEEALTWRATILDAATSAEPRMPPAGGPPPEERERLRIWLTCFAGVTP